MQDKIEMWRLYIQTGGFRQSQEAFNTIWIRYYKPVLYFIQSMVHQANRDDSVQVELPGGTEVFELLDIKSHFDSEG